MKGIAQGSPADDQDHREVITSRKSFPPPPYGVLLTLGLVATTACVGYAYQGSQSIAPSSTTATIVTTGQSQRMTKAATLTATTTRRLGCYPEDCCDGVPPEEYGYLGNSCGGCFIKGYYGPANSRDNHDSNNDDSLFGQAVAVTRRTRAIGGENLVRVISRDNTQDLTSSRNRFGSSVSLAKRTESTLAVGAPGGTGSVTIYQRLEEPRDEWIEVITIPGLQGRVGFGTSVALSSDGSVLVVAAQDYVRVYKITINVDQNGRAYSWDADWETLGQTIRNRGGTVGGAVAVSEDGQTLATLGETSGSGFVQVYQYTNNNRWAQLGSNIVDGPPTNSAFDGAVALAPSPRGWMVAYTGNGFVRVAEYNKSESSSTGGWDPIGQVMRGVGTSSQYSVAVARNGASLATGSRDDGSVRSYSLDEDDDHSSLQWKEEDVPAIPGPSSAAAVAFGPHGEDLIVGRQGDGAFSFRAAEACN